MHTLTLADLQQRQVDIAPHEAVAIVRQLMSHCLDRDTTGLSTETPSLDAIAIADDGSVLCGEAAAVSSIADLARVLEALLAHTGSRVSGPLRYALARALQEVDAPPYNTLDEFADALSRFERAPADEVVAALHRRAIPDGDRRRRTPSATEVRRHLREADLRLFQIQQLAAGGLQPPASGGTRSWRTPLTACMITGALLIAAGEWVRVSEPHAQTAPHLASGHDIALATPVQTVAPSPEDRPNVTGLTAAAAGDGVVAKPAVARPRASRPTIRTMRQATPSRVTKPSRRLPRARDDDRGLLRIRFEWDNPFR